MQLQDRLGALKLHSRLHTATHKTSKSIRWVSRTYAVQNTQQGTDTPLSVPTPSSQATASKNIRADQRYKLFLDNWDKGFMETKEDPEGYWVDCIYGSIPKDLTGTFLRNGPGKFTLGTDKIDHPYDADGIVASIAFKDGSAYFRSRFVDTKEYQLESKAKSILWRGTFATQRRPPRNNMFDLHVKNTSNTNVIHHGGKLWSLFEAGQPYILDPATLETRGLETLDGQLSPGLPMNLGSSSNNQMIGMFSKLAQNQEKQYQLPQELLNAGGDAVTAHPHVDPRNGHLVLFSYQVRPILPDTVGGPIVGTDIKFWELDKDMKPVDTPVEFFIKGFAFVHDFAMTENYYIVFQNPVTVDNAPYLLGKAPAASCVRWVDNTPTLVHIIPRPHLSGSDKQQQVRTFTAPPLFVFHHANAYEDLGNNKLVIDSIHYTSLPAVGREALAEQKVDANAAFSSRLRRVVIDLDTHVLSVRCAFDGYLEMPAINPNYFSKPHQYVYGYHSLFEDPQIAVAKIDMKNNVAETWSPGVKRFALEPRFIPRAADSNISSNKEDDGWLICQLFDANDVHSEIVILDAADIQKGPVAVLKLRDAMPSALHSCWTDEWYGPVDKTPPRSSANVIPFNGIPSSSREQ